MCGGSSGTCALDAATRQSSTPTSASAGADGPAAPTVTVVGAGPAGAVTTAVLLIRGATVHWVDEAFAGAGGLSDWKGVPANTKVNLLTPCLDGLPGISEWKGIGDCDVLWIALSNLSRPPSGWSLSVNGDPAPNGWCRLDELAAVIAALADVLRARWGPGNTSHSRLRCHTARAGRLNYNSASGKWEVELSKTPFTGACRSLVVSDSLVLATGGAIKAPPAEIVVPGVRVLSQDTALVPSALASAGLDPTQAVAVVGNSHSAFVIIENLYSIGFRNVLMFARRPLRFAVFDEETNFYTGNAFDGLKVGPGMKVPRRSCVGALILPFSLPR